MKLHRSHCSFYSQEIDAKNSGLHTLIKGKEAWVDHRGRSAVVDLLGGEVHVAASAVPRSDAV